MNYDSLVQQLQTNTRDNTLLVAGTPTEEGLKQIGISLRVLEPENYHVRDQKGKDKRVHLIAFAFAGMLSANSIVQFTKIALDQIRLAHSQNKAAILITDFRRANMESFEQLKEAVSRAFMNSDLFQIQRDIEMQIMIVPSAQRRYFEGVQFMISRITHQEAIVVSDMEAISQALNELNEKRGAKAVLLES